MAFLYHCGRYYRATRYLLHAKNKDLYQYEWLLVAECKKKSCKLPLMAYQKIGHDGKLYPATPHKIPRYQQAPWETRLKTDLVAGEDPKPDDRDTRAIPIVSDATKEMSLDPAIGNTAQRVIKRLAS